MASPAIDGTDLWDVALPPPTSCRGRLAMAGFEQRPGTGVVDLTPLPHPAVTLVVDLADDSFSVEDARGQRHVGTVVAGVLPGDVRAEGSDVRCLQIRLDPPLAAQVLGVPLGELDGAVVGLDELWGSDARRLRERLHDAGSWDDRFSIVETAIRGRLDHGRRVDGELAFAWARIRGAHGRLRVEDLTAETGWSRQRLWSRFRAQLGLSPKRAAMLARFDLAAHRLASGVPPARVAAELGYADQSHLHREVRTFAGATPSAVARSTWLSVDDHAWPRTAG